MLVVKSIHPHLALMICGEIRLRRSQHPEHLLCPLFLSLSDRSEWLMQIDDKGKLGCWAVIMHLVLEPSVPVSND
jgi:hypothetical protein